MAKKENLYQKLVRIVREEGVDTAVAKGKNYIKLRVSGDPTRHYFKDVLFINGCYLPHPTRYRVEHQIEQLRAYGLTADSMFYERVDEDIVKYYRAFVFFRCPITEDVSRIIDLAKYYNKPVFFDIDDLVIDKQYTDLIPYLKTMSKEEKRVYDDGVERTKQTLLKCDYAITTTSALAKELKKYVGDVYINRNVASEKMLKYSERARKTIKKDSEKILLGYFSGSITHNSDFEMILPVIKKIMLENEKVYLKIVGELNVPDELQAFKDRILAEPFVEWKKLPELVATVDINLAPLEDTLFNAAKSENKWLEAAMVCVPTIASKVGAFEEEVENGVTGVLCADLKEWEKELERLISDEKYRKEIGYAAYKKSRKRVTTYSGRGITEYIISKLQKNFGFVLPTTNISGGVNVIIKHCNILRSRGYDVFIVNKDKNSDDIFNKDGRIPVIQCHDTRFEGFVDTLTASLWSTLGFVKCYPNVLHKAYLVQNFETDFNPDGYFEKTMANATYNSLIPIHYLTISKWCQDWLKEEFGKDSIYVPNGIDLKVFEYKERNFKGKIRILVEGNSDDYYKNVDESFKIIEKLDKNKYEIYYLSYQGKAKEWYHVDKFLQRVPHDKVGKIYQSCDILLKTSILESFSYPPLEMMATGGIAVVAPNGGNKEYLRNEENCLLYNRGRIDEAVKQIERVLEDSELRKKIIKGGLATADSREWSKIEDKIVLMYTKLEEKTNEC